jgi:hypothetical protein
MGRLAILLFGALALFGCSRGKMDGCVFPVLAG